MEEKELTIEEIHQFTLGNLKKIIEICDKLSINYFLAYGTLLGAVRHKGFIPWDDDFDIIMFRPDYDKFCEYCIKNEKTLAPYKLINKYTATDYPYNISRFSDSRFRMQRMDNIPDAGVGVFIDIYPYEGVGNCNKVIAKYFGLRNKLLMMLWDFSFTDRYTTVNSNIIFSILKAPVVWYAHKRGARHFLNKLDKLNGLFDFNKSTYVATLVWEDQFISFMKDIFMDYKYMEFEGIKVKVPNDWDYFLRQFYGDYMKLPPKEQQVATHNYKLFYKSSDKRL